MKATIQAEPYTARQCPECEEWVYVAAGPFNEEGKPYNEIIHYDSEHGGPTMSIGQMSAYPFMSYNEETVAIEVIVIDPSLN